MTILPLGMRGDYSSLAQSEEATPDYREQVSFNIATNVEIVSIK